MLGEITGSHGLQGGVRVRVAGDDPEHLLAADALWVGRSAEDPEARRRVVRDRGQAPGGEVRLRFEGIESREQASALVGLLVTASPDHLRPLPDGEFYWYQLIGCRVESESGEIAGRVREIWETGAHDVLVVEDERGLRRLIPTAEALTVEIDVDAGRIVVKDLPGLLEPT